jgi:outer membrane protein assembly factor BamA
MWASTSAGGWNFSKHRTTSRWDIVCGVVLAFCWVIPGVSAHAQAPAATPPVPVRVLPPTPAAPLTSTQPVLEPQVDLSPCLGKPLAKVEVAVDGEAWGNARLPTVLGVKRGEPITGAVARRALTEVLDTSQFARARVVAVEDGGGCHLVVKVVARKLIETLQVELGGAKIEREELLHEGDFAEGGELVGADLADKQDRMEAFLARHGYPDATITLTTRLTNDPLRVFVLLEVHAKEPRIIGRRVFYVYDAKPEQIVSSTDTYKVKVGERTDETALEAADNALEARMRGEGFHQADVSHDVVDYAGTIVLRVRVDAGKLYLARFEGNDHFDADALVGALGTATDSDLTPVHLVEKVRDFYKKHGFLDVEVTLEERGTARDAQHHLVFKIIEHQRVAVIARAYPCLKEGDIRRLTEGGPTSASAIGSEIDSFLEEELPGADLVVDPHPQGLDDLLRGAAGSPPTGARPVPIDLDPDATYVADTYDRAVLHVQELYRGEGFLHAQVGPAQTLRRRCSPRSKPGTCVPIPFPPPPPELCTYDATNLPLPIAALDPAFTCVPDPTHGVECETRMSLRIPIKLGPRTTLYDLLFTGVRALTEPQVARAADLLVGDPASALKLEEARRHILDLYKEEGYAFADVKYGLEESLDHTRARARFEITEGEQVIVRQIVIQGNEITRDGVIRRRIALEVGKPYKASDVRKTQERIATLNVFSSVNVALADPEVPQKDKTVIITVSETLPKYIEIRPGFSTGEGIRLTTEFGDRNLFGTAIGVSTRASVSYLPNALILDDQVRTNFETLTALERVAGRLTLRGELPEIGLGPLVRMGVDAVLARTLNRDFVLLKAAFIPSIIFTPVRERPQRAGSLGQLVQFTISPTAERNSVKIFQQRSLAQFLTQLSAAGASRDIGALLRVPDGDSNAFAQRFTVTYDRRDNSFNAHKGTYFVSGIEHVDWYPLRPLTQVSTFDNAEVTGNFSGHFVRFTETIAGYVPITKKITLAAELRVGTNMQMVNGSHTYPDRLFFLGGVESMRGWLQDSFIPQDYADKIEADKNLPDNDPSHPKFTAGSIAIRGGNLMINPKLELRIPVKGAFETAIFSDIGNLWVDAEYPFKHGAFPIRASIGSGIRYQTPIGPLAFDYGINLTRKSYEDFGAFHFAIGLF